MMVKRAALMGPLALATCVASLAIGCCAGAKKTPTETVVASTAEPVTSVPASAALPSRPAAAFVPAIAALIADPASLKPKKTEKTQAYTVRRYTVAGLKEAKLTTMNGDASDWFFEYRAAGAHIEDLAEDAAVDVVCDTDDTRWYAIKRGPLAGNFAMAGGEWIQIASRQHILVSGRAIAHGWDPGHYSVACVAVSLCASGSVETAHKLDHTTMVTGCRDVVKNQLKAPSTAEFQGVFDGYKQPERSADCGYTWSSWVEASNAFGVKLRNQFTCTWDPETDIIHAKLAQ